MRIKNIYCTKSRLLITLLLILAAAWSACAPPTDDLPPAEVLSCFAKGTDILVPGITKPPTIFELWVGLPR